MADSDPLAAHFESHRPHLRSVAYRMLGSLSDADDAVQEGWLRLSRADTAGIDNFGGWLTTVVARICLDMLRTRESRREEHVGSATAHLPEPVVSLADHEAEHDPEHAALLADSVGLALLVALETLAPTERLAFVLHDVFGVPFEEIAPIVGRSPAAARQLASRARRRIRQVKGATAAPDADLSQQRQVVNAFLAAARDGDFAALLEVLDPDVVLRADRAAVPTPTAAPPSTLTAAGGPSGVRGARVVAEQALTFIRLAPFAQPVLVNGTPGFLVSPHGKPFAVLAFTVANGRIATIDVVTNPTRLARIAGTARPNDYAGTGPA